jgi:hypothetical protein
VQRSGLAGVDRRLGKTLPPKYKASVVPLSKKERHDESNFRFDPSDHDQHARRL